MLAEPLAIAVFFATLLLTFATSIYARLKSGAGSEEDLAGRSLNKWLVGLSAATTGNSGFVVTGAVGLGYAGGVQWLLLPLGWLLGDLVYWSFFPDKINRVARETGAATLPELLTNDLDGRGARGISILVALILAGFLSIYTAAQWLAGEKVLGAIFQLTELTALAAFGLVIVIYSAIGGFRGSVYVDTLQAVIRVGGTALALYLVIHAATAMGPAFDVNIAAAGADFLDPFAGRGVWLGVAFALGFGGAAIGFGLGQPQIVSRYMAGESPEETKAARWIYIAFLQGTWLAMTVFGVILRGVDPSLADPEAGLSQFFQSHAGAVATGIILADIFATIAGTSNGLLIAISQTIQRDLFNRPGLGKGWAMALTLVIGLVTILLSFMLPGNVYTLAVGAISMIGSALAAAVIIKVFRHPHTAGSLLTCILVGPFAAMAWHFSPLGAAFNETAIGIAASLVAHAIYMRLMVRPA